MKTFNELKRNLKCDMSALTTVKVALLGDTATQFLATAIRGYGYERGYCIDLYEAEYNQVERQVLDPTSDLYRFGADYVVVFQSTHKLLEKYSLAKSEAQASLADDRIDFVNNLCSLVKAKVIYYNYPEIGDSVPRRQSFASS